MRASCAAGAAATAPLGSSSPEPCPTSGFYCPGALRDDQFGGAKPIIMPVGQSTRQEQAAAVTQTMTLDITIDDFAAQREALIAQLQVQVAQTKLQAQQQSQQSQRQQ